MIPNPPACRAPLGRRVAQALASPASLALAVVLSCAAAAHAATEERTFHQSATAAAGATLTLENIAGTIHLVGTPGREVVVDARIHAEAGSGEAARTLADSLHLALAGQEGRLVLTADYPLDSYTTYHYPRPDREVSFFGFNFSDQAESKYHGRRIRVVGAPSARAATLWADFTIALPAGVGASIRNIAGEISGEGVDGPLALDIAWGGIRATGGRGDLTADTGSGDVTVRDRHGSVRIDTGSGDVVLERLSGNVDVDTGSGSARLTAVDGGVVSVDTGSGDVLLDEVHGTLSFDTGSGAIRGSRLAASGHLAAETGSGDVILAGDFARVTGLRVSTGSGDVAFTMSALPALRLSVSTGSGDIAVELPDTRIRYRRDDELEAEIRGGGAGVADISTGSGDVRVTGS